jgi:LemA protein
MGSLIILGLLLVLPALVLVGMYNGLIRRRNAVENAFGGIDAQLKMRYDLIPNLVASVKQYMQHEAGTLEQLTALRSRAVGGGLGTDEKVAVGNEIGRALRGLWVAVENYPQLRASENVQQLQRSLNEIEDRLSASRRAYNAAVTDFNNAVETFPSNLMASLMALRRKSVFEAPEAERQNVSVSALFKS